MTDRRVLAEVGKAAAVGVLWCAFAFLFGVLAHTAWFFASAGWGLAG